MRITCNTIRDLLPLFAEKMTEPETQSLIEEHLKECPECHSNNVDYMTRIIGYLKRVSNFSEPRQQEANRRYYATPEKL